MEKKILFVVDEFLPISTAGATRINSFLKECVQTYDVALLCGKECESPSDKIPAIKYISIQRPDEKSFLAPFLFLFYFMRFNRRLIRISKRFDLVVVSIPRYEFLYSITKLRKNNRRYVLDIRDLLESKNYELIFQRFLPQFLARLLAHGFEKQKKRLLKKAIKESAVTTVAYKGLYTFYTQSFPQWKEKIFHIPNGVDLEYFPKRKNKPKKEKLRILYIGNFAEKDYLKPIVKEIGTFKEKENIELIFAGDGRERKEIERHIELYQLKKQTTFIGKIPHKEIHTLEKKSDLGIIMRDPGLPTLLPVSVVEYMALSLPVLVNDYSELGEFVRETHAGYIVKDPREINDLLTKLVRNKKALLRIGKKNREWIEKNGSRQVIAKKFKEEIIEKYI